MSNSIYQINKGINRPIEFRGLKSQYIMYLAAGLLSLLVIFAIAYILKVPVYVCLAITILLGFAHFTVIYNLNHKYGEHGLMKKSAYKQVPTSIVCHSRNVFTSLAGKAS